MENEGSKNEGSKMTPKPQHAIQQSQSSNNSANVYPSTLPTSARPGSFPAHIPLPVYPSINPTPQQIANYSFQGTGTTTSTTKTPMGLTTLHGNLGKNTRAAVPKSGPAAERISTLVSFTQIPSLEQNQKKPAIRKKKANRRRFSQIKRTPVDSSAVNSKTDTLNIADSEPDRVVNPLVDIPPVETMELQHAAEMYAWSDVVFGRPDTYPLSYHARLLGFQVPSAPPDKYVALDPSTIPLVRDVPEIPPLGRVTWDEENVLDYRDPVYKALVVETCDVVESLKRANLNVTGRFLKQECLALAKELLGDDLPAFTLDDRGNFGIKASDGTSIRYQFVWYQFKSGEGRKEPAAKVGPYGVTSLASHIKKPKVSELTIHISWLGKGEPPPIKSTLKDSSTISEIQGSTVTTAVTEKQPDSKPQDSSLSQEAIITAVNEEKEKNEGNPISPEQGQTDVTNTSERVLIVLTALALEHARACDILYGFAQVPEIWSALLSKYFRMTPLKKNGSSPRVLLCDLKSNSSKYAFLLHKAAQTEKTGPMEDNDRRDLRILVRLPHVETLKRAMNGVEKSTAKAHRGQKPSDSIPLRSAAEPTRSLSFSLRVETSSDDVKSVTGDLVAEIKTADLEKTPSFDVLRFFQTRSSDKQEEKDEILETLAQKQDELVSIERKIEPSLRGLLGKVVDDRLQFENAAQRRKEVQDRLKGYQAILDRRKELDMAFQKQRDQDMDAVCEICNDGEVTPDNQILFCEACNVAIHQFCYGIEKVPQGDYYCIACRFFGREKMNFVVARQNERGASLKMAPSPLPINCELCPQRQGAFIRTDTSSRTNNKGEPSVSRWVHMLCAKWQGLNFVDNQKKDCVEDVSELKQNFRLHGITCQLCGGDRGAFNQCRFQGCNKWLHITCARSYGECEVVHGENCHGGVLHNPWSLMCPDHSEVEKPPRAVSLDHLKLLAKAFPPEPKIEKPKPKVSKSFGKMSGNERREFLSDPKNELTLVTELLTKKLHGVRCEVCYTVEEEGKNLTKCIDCASVFCDSCKIPYDTLNQDIKQFKCPACRSVEEAKSKNEPYESPSCVLCFQKGGWLRMARGAPMKKWQKHRQKEYEKTMFGKPLWTHSLCALWQYPSLFWDETKKEVNLSNVIMTHGRGFILKTSRCEICGQDDGLKMRCAYPACRQRGQLGKASTAHVTCARQVGFQVDNRPSEKEGLDTDFFIHCYRHASCEYAFRARLEDLIELEKGRIGKRLDNQDSKPMSLNHASRMLNAAIVVGQYLGWAWRWAEWWVENGSNWEPLIEEGQDERKMTKAQLKIVESTRESRCKDARRCRLAAFGAALRNRSYDNEEDGPTVMLDRALRAVLNTKSLVGPLSQHEKDFFAQWLGIAYRSKSRLLGYGDDKISVNESSPPCLHEEDKSPKFVLGSRRLPGKQVLPDGEVFESNFTEIDDFLKPERLDDGTLFSEVEKMKKEKQKTSKGSAKRGAGRPKKNPVDPDLSEKRQPKLAVIDRSRTSRNPPTLESESTLGKTPKSAPVTEDATVKPSSPKRQRKPTAKGSHYWGNSAEESVLAIRDRSGTKGKESRPSESVGNGGVNAKKSRRQTAPADHHSDTKEASSTDDARPSPLGRKAALSIDDARPSPLGRRSRTLKETTGEGGKEVGKNKKDIEKPNIRKRSVRDAPEAEEAPIRRPRRTSAPLTYNEEMLLGAEPSPPDASGARAGSRKGSRARPSSASRDAKAEQNDVGLELQDEGRRSGRRKSSHVSYHEYDSGYSEEEPVEVADADASRKSTRGQAKSTPKKTTPRKESLVNEPAPRRSLKRKLLAFGERREPVSTAEEAEPLSSSSFSIPRKKKGVRNATADKDKEDAPEPRSQPKRGRHGVKLEAAQTSLL